MFVLGIGSAVPPVTLQASDVDRFGARVDAGQRAFLQRAGIRSRRISLPLDYLTGSSERNLFEAWKAASHSPTALAKEAAVKALASAGIDVERVGLVLGDTATPYQRCPSEAQRLAGEFSVKIAAYDTTAGVGAIPNFLSMLAAWKPERVPEYVLCVATNTPSQYIGYGSDALSASLFGDAAVALVLSATHARGLQVVYSKIVAEPLFRAPFVVEQTISCNLDSVVSSEELESFIKAELETLKAFNAELAASCVIIPPQMYAQEASEILGRCGVSAERIATTSQEYGFSLGSALGVALEQRWNEAVQHDRPIVLLHCGDGLRGSIALKKC
jgi:3-oxoacyl-[acyl-carrier-protein] synthase III